jgi:hypothetical protein
MHLALILRIIQTCNIYNKGTEMIKLKSILKEGYSWERKADGSLPTLADSIAAYEAKLREEAELNMPFGDNDEDADSKMVDESEKPDYFDADGDGNEKESMKDAFADKEKSTSYKTQVLWDADMKELQKDIKKIKQQHSKVEVSAVTRKGNGHQVTVKIFQDDTNESTLIKKAGIQEMREISLEQRILRNYKGSEYILRETFKK